MASRILGLVRDQVLAFFFGASDAMDAYRIGFKIPNLVRDLFAEGAMSAAFVPTFTRYLHTAGQDAAWRLGSLVMTALVAVTGVLVILGVLFAEPLVGLIAGSYAGVPVENTSQDKLTLTVTLARIMLPTLTLIAVAAALMGMLNSLRHFFIPALSPAMFNVATIVCALAFVPIAPRLGLVHPIVVIAVGTLLGGVAQLAIQWPSLRREGFRYRPMLDWSDPGLRAILVLMGPGTIGLAATQLNVVVNAWLAAGEGTGAVTWLDLAFRLMYLPIGIFGVSIGTAVLPAVSRHLAANERTGARDTIASGLSLMMMLNVPATVGLMVLAVPIVRVIFEHGEFTPEDTLRTAAAVQLYAIGLVGYSVVRIASPAFYALGRNRTPVVVSIVTVMLNATLNYILVRRVGYTGLALGTSIAALFNAAMLFVLLRRPLHGLNEARLAGSLLRIAVASALMGTAAWAADAAFGRWLAGDRLTLQIARLAASIGVALAVLVASGWLLRIRELNESLALVLRRVWRRS
jgi:putative peptidoglycan lipid II flippase